MKEYLELLKILKVSNLSVQILHRHLVGENWFGDHKQLSEYYEHLQDDVDTFCELGLANAIDEPTIQQALDTYKEVEIKNRNARDSYIIVKELFDEIVAQINRISGLPADVINRLQEAQEYYRVEAGFKLFRATMDEIES